MMPISGLTQKSEAFVARGSALTKIDGSPK